MSEAKMVKMESWFNRADPPESGLYEANSNLKRPIVEYYCDWADDIAQHHVAFGSDGFIVYAYVFPPGTTIKECKQQLPTIVDLLRAGGCDMGPDPIPKAADRYPFSPFKSRNRKEKP
jgi:hypothetical protein